MHIERRTSERQVGTICLGRASVPFFDPAASTSAAAAAVAASPPSQVDAWGVVLGRGEAVVRRRGTALCRLCGWNTAVILVSRYLPSGADGVEELDIIGGCPFSLTHSSSNLILDPSTLSVRV